MIFTHCSSPHIFPRLTNKGKHKAEIFNFESPIAVDLYSTTMATATFVLPGEVIDPSILLSQSKAPIKLGPGLRHIPPNTITPVVAGQLCTDPRKNAIWIEYNSGRVSQYQLLWAGVTPSI